MVGVGGRWMYVDGGWVDGGGWMCVDGGWVDSVWMVGGGWESPFHEALYYFVLRGFTAPLGKEQVFIE